MFHSKLRVSLMFVGVVMMPGPGAGWLEERRSGLLTRTGTGGGPARADLFWTFTNSNSEDSLEPPLPCGGAVWVDILLLC